MDLQEFRNELLEDAKAAAAADGEGTSSAFAAIVAGYLIDKQILPDYTPAFFTGEGKRRAKLRIDGFALDDLDNTMNVVVVNYNGSPEEQRLTRTEAENIFAWPTRFIDETLNSDLHLRLEISTPACDLADLLRINRDRIRKYRLLLVTDSVMSDRIDSLAVKEIGGVPVECQIWDASRLYKVCFNGPENVEIDFTQYTRGGLPCLEASHGTDAPYRCFLCVIPGQVLTNIYDRWGAQLLEGNVRSFLSTKVAVNKNIRQTILTEPSMFFAFNNGVSATAVGVKVESRPEGRFVTYARDFQIINGGQTTASLSNARHKDKAELSTITVQMKLTEINDPEEAQEMVQKIARSSNSQNKVSDADFFSTHPFHIRMEQISRRLFAPPVGGAQYETHWFYERARGQYLQAQMRMTKAEIRRFVTQHPKNQMLTKTDLAKVRNSWRGHPHTVSKGAQTNFVDFANWIGGHWSESEASFNEQYYRDSVALFIVFRHIEKLVSQQPWYQNGYRANVVTYSIALLAQLIKKQFPGKTLDLQKIWSRQDVPEVVTKALTVITKSVMESITDPRRSNANVTQWCKKEECWKVVQALPVQLPLKMETALQDTEDAIAEHRAARKDQELVAGINAQTDVVQRGPEFWKKLAIFLMEKRLLSPEEQRALTTACEMPKRVPNEIQSKKLLRLVQRAAAEGYTA